MNEYVIRFSVERRIEHACVMLLFLVLAVSGFAQKFFEAQWAQWLIAAMGGLQNVRWVPGCRNPVCGGRCRPPGVGPVPGGLPPVEAFDRSDPQGL